MFKGHPLRIIGQHLDRFINRVLATVAGEVIFYLGQFACNESGDFEWSEQMSEHIDDLWR